MDKRTSFWYGVYYVSRAKQVRIPEYDCLDNPYIKCGLDATNPVEELLMPIDRCEAFDTLGLLHNHCPNLKRVAVTAFDNCCEPLYNNPLKGIPFLQQLSAKMQEYNWDAYVIFDEYGPRLPSFPRLIMINEQDWEKKCGTSGEDLS